MTLRRAFRQDTIAIVYDFDGTLSPQPMQEYTVLPEIGIGAERFWEEVRADALANQGEGMLTYMRLLLEHAERARVALHRPDFIRLGGRIRYFPGVEGWFQRINTYVAETSGSRVKVRHYLVSAGLREILEGASISKHFHRIYASEYHYDHHGVPRFPKVVITDTIKTQYLFRINKGREGIAESINDHMAEEERPIPFPNIIYVGDGMTDVPSMAVTKQNGGHTVAVHKPRDPDSVAVCRELLRAGRVHFIAGADYVKGGELERRVKLLLQAVIANIAYQRELFVCRREHLPSPENTTPPPPPGPPGESGGG